jgi:hypothetical protein
MPSKLLQDVADYCWSKNFLDVFRKFFTDHAEAFEGAAPALGGGEHNLEYYDLFQTYLKLYETTLVQYLRTLDVSIEDFYKDVREAQKESVGDPYLSTFIDCLLASADYESFYKVMAREGGKSAARKMATASVVTIAESKGESKSSSKRYDGSKKGGDSDDDLDDDADYKSSSRHK